MNKTYRTVWNATTGTWAAAEETARSKSKGSSRAASKAFVAVALGGMAIGGASAADVVGASESADGKTDDDSVIQVPITGTKSLMPMGTTGTLSTDSVGTMAALDDAYIKVRVGHYAPGTAAVAGDGSVAIGASADASAQSAVALGGNASATGQNATALGALASATNFNTLAAGVGAAASGNASTALGRGAATSGAYGVAVGYTANSSGTSAVAMGVGASASGNSSVAVGDGAAASVANSAAIGSFSVANRTNTVSVGSATLQRQITNVAAGTQANDAVNLSQMNAAIAAADNPYIGIRSGVYAPATPAVVGDGATAIGAAATAGALSSVAFGGGAVASNQNAMALGTISRAAGQETVAVGVGAGALANNAIALGRGATSSAAGATALGTYAVASANESVALGDGAVADRTNTVSVGSTTLRRQITNMAAGSQATDAVNVSQLTPVVNALGGGATINATTGAVTGPTYSLANPAGGPGRVNYNNVGDALTNLDSRTSQNTGDISDLQDKLADTGLVGGDGNTLAAVTYDQNADGTPNYGSVTLGGEGAATPVAIHNVAAGNLSATSTDAVNGSQLFATNTRVGSLEDSLKNGGAIDPITGESLAVVYDSAAKNHVTLGGTGASNPVVLSNVAQGVAGTDAVNVDQLNAAVANSSGPNPYIGGRGTGVAAQATGINAVALGLGSLANEINTISVGNSTTGLQRRITNVADGQNDNDAATIGQVNSLVGGATSTMSAAIDDVNNRISALGNGIGGSTSDIGLMGGLDGGTASGTNIAVGTGSSVSQTGRYNPTNGLAIGQNASVTDGDVAGASGAIAIGSSASASGSNAITIGTNSKNANSNTTAVGANTLVSGGGASAFGSGATASGANSLALGANSIANRGNAVSVGSDTLQRQITNLAAGTQTTDAVNLGQLNAAIAAVDNPYVKVDGQHDGSDDARVAAGSFGVAIGADANASGTTAIAMGAQATSTGTSSVALGAGAAATNSNAVALGGNSSASGANAIGLGAGTVASQNNAVAMGFNARALAANAVALGNTASAAAADSLAFGTLARVDAGATNGVAIGRAASVTGAAQNSVALGANSVADRLNSIAVGSTAQQRQIIYVSRGTADTDAVNVSQLKDAVAAFGGNAAVGADGSIVNPTYTVDGSTYHNVGDALNALAQRSGGGTDPLAVTYEQNPDGSANFDLVSLKGGANGTTITNVAAGAVNATSKDAINGSQLYGTAQSVADALGGGSAVDGNGNVTAPTYSLADPAGGAGKVDYDNVGDALANLDGRTTQNTGDIVDLQDKLEDTGLVDGNGDTRAAVTYDKNADGTPNYGSVTLGDGTGPVKVTNVADGTLSATSTDAVNGSQLFATNQSIGDLSDSLKNGGVIDPVTGQSLAVVYDSAAKDTVTLGGAGAATPVQLKNVAAGTDDTDAVNVGQLKDTGLVGDDGQGNLTSLAVTYDDATKAGITLGNAGTPVAIHNVAEGDLSATSTDAVNGSQLFATNQSIGDLSDSLKNGGVIDPITGQSLAVVYDSAAKDRVTLGNTGTPVVLSNVAAGTDDTDAVNVSQLKRSGLIDPATGQPIAAVTYDRNADGTPNYGSVTLGDGTGPVKVTNVADATGDSDAVNLGQLKDTGLVGDDGQGGLTSLAVTYDDATKAGITLGNAGTPVAIHNVAAGDLSATSTDAVNGSQLFMTNTRVGSMEDWLNNSGLIDPATGGSLAVVYDGTAKDTVTLAGVDGTTLSNVKAGVADTDAVNVSQLKGSGLIDPVTGQPIAAVTYDRNADGTPNYGSVTLGDGNGPVKVTNVADATGDSDAVNLGQLKDTGLVGDDGQGSLTSLAVTYDDATKAGITLGNAGTPVAIHNVAAGDLSATSTDAVNGSQLFATNQSIGDLSDSLKDGGVIDPTTGESLAVVYDSAAKDRVTLGNAGTPVTLSNVAAGVGDTDAVNVGQLKDTGLVGDDGQGGLTSLAVTYDDATKAGITLGNAGTPVAIHNVADGALSATSTDAVNGSQLFATNQSIGDLSDSLKDGGVIDPTTGESLAVVYDSAAKDRVTLAGANGTTLTNVADGALSATSTDAVNGSQLFATNQSIGDLSDSLKNGGVIDPVTGQSLAVVYDSATKDRVTLGNAGTPVTLSNVAAGAADTDAVNYGQMKDYVANNAGGPGNALAVAYDDTSRAAITLEGANGTTITNVAAGAVNAASTDAINGSQLYGTAQSVADALGGGSAVDGNGNVTAPTYSLADPAGGAGKVDYDNVGDALANLDGRTTQNTGDIVDLQDKLADTGLVDGNGDTRAAVTYDKNADGTPNYGSVTLGDGNGPVKVTNVADGTLSATSTDAVNGSQLFATNQSIGDLSDSLKNGGVIDPVTGQSLAVVYDSAAKDRVTLGNAGTPVTLSNVAAGVADTDAVNVSQLRGSGLLDPATGQPIAAVTYDRNADGTPNYGSVTLGDGNGPVKVTNVADATGDSDAVNLGQLKDTGLVGDDGQGGLTSLAVTYDDATKAGITLGNAGTPVAIHNVAAGDLSATSTDAVNGSQLFATNQSIGDLSDSLKNGGVIDPITGQSLAVVYDSAAKDTVTLGGAGAATPVQLKNVAAGTDDTDAVNVSQLKGSGLIDPATGQPIAAVTYDRNADGTPNYGSVTLGDGNGPVKVTNVADATGDSDAVNLGQLKDTGLVGEDGQGNLTSLAVTYDDATKAGITLGNAGTPVAIHNVAEGDLSATSTDAVNGSQLFATNTRVGSLEDSLNNSGLIDPITGQSLAVVYDSTAKDQVTLGGVGAAAPVQLKNVAAGTDDTDAVNLAQLKDAGLVAPIDPTNPGTGLASLAVTYGKNADDSPNYDQVTLKGGANGTTLSNVAAGTLSATSTDAVNGSQLFATNQNLGDLSDSLKNGGVIDPTTGESLAVVYDDATKAGVTLGNAGTPVAIHNVADGVLSATSKDAVNGSQLFATNQSIGDLSDSLKNGGVIDPTTGESLAVVYDNAAKDRVTLGNTGTPVTLSNVAAGVGDTDAVNVGQLKDTGLVGDDGQGNLTSLAVTYDDATKAGITLGNAGTPVAIHNVAAGDLSATSTDAVNGSQLFATNTRVGSLEDSLQNGGVIDPITGQSLAVVYDSAAKDTVTLGGVGAAAPVQLKNVAAGTDDTDAVNVAQLKDAGLVAPIDPTNPGAGLASLAVTYDKHADDSANFDQITLKGGANGTTLTNVAAGAVNATSKDAINGSQLYGTAQSVADSLGGGSTVGADGSVTNPTYSLADPADASQKADYHNVGDALANLDGRVVDNTTNITVIKNQLADSGLVDPVTGQSIAAVTYDRNADGTPNYGSVSLGNGSGPVRVSNVADGVARNDAVNLGQLQDAGLVAPVDPTNPGSGLASLAVTYDKHADGSANFDRITLAGANGTTITNVKAGAVSATSTDAVNGAQLHGVAQSVADSLGGGSTVGADGSVTSPTYVVNNQTFNNVGDAITNISNSLADGSIGLVQQDGTTRDITVAKDTDGTLVDFAGTAGDRVLTGVAAGAVNATSKDAVNGSQLYGTAQSVADVIGGGTTVDADGKLADTAIEVNGYKYKTVAEAVQAAAAYGATDPLAVRYDLNADGTPNYGSVTLGGTAAAPVVLTNVADGVNKYDAVNYGQLSDLRDQFSGLDDRVGALEQNPGNGGGGGGGGGSGDNPYFAGTGDADSTAANAGTGTGNTAAGSGANVGGGANNGTVIGSGSNVLKDNGTAIGSGASSTGEGATAIGSGANASGNQSVAIGAGSVANEANTVSFGNGTDEGNRRIVNIADGINANDAASKGQLDRAVGGLQGQINDVSKNAYSGIAAATALTMIPGVDPGKTLSFGVGGATYKGYQAVAFGGEARITQNLKMKAGVGLSSGGNTVGVGASYQW